MFFTFLNKENHHNINLSSIFNYGPEQILFYYYDSFINLPFNTYERLMEIIETMEKPDPLLNEWRELLEEDLGASPDLVNLKSNDFIQRIGPYYHVLTNTRFYFTKEQEDQSELTADDFATILALQITPAPDQLLHKYNKTRKNAKKIAKNKEELLEDLTMCISALKETEKLNKHINCLNKILEMRYAIIEKDIITPPEPDNLPEKPDKPAENERTALTNLIPFSRSRSKHAPKTNSNYNHDIKVYYIRYREYEKACDRYKNALELWTDLSAVFRNRCLFDIDKTELKLKTANRMLTVYNHIIIKSFIHPDYQDIKTLTTFKHYLETGRAKDLQDCMNVFEEEKHWSEIKASQERIENTIYFLQTDNEHYLFAEQKINEILSRNNVEPEPEPALEAE